MQPETSQPALPPACPLAALPAGVLEDILVRSGLHSRHLCRAFRAIHPPARSLAPHGIRTPDELTAALATLPHSLTSLDVRHVDPGAITPGALAALLTTVPHLQRLLLPPASHSVLRSMLEALHHLPDLDTLVAAGSLCPDGPQDCGEPVPEVPWPSLLQPPAAAHLRSLTLPIEALAALHVARSCTLPQLTAIAFCLKYNGGAPVDAQQLASLLHAAPMLRRLSLGTDAYATLRAVNHLASLATLTALCLDIALEPMSDLLPAIGTLTALRHLRLDLLFPCKGYPCGLGGGWLRRLTLLTQLDIELHLHARDDIPDDFQVPFAPLLDEPLPGPARIATALLQAAAALPQLQDLRLLLAHPLTGVCDLDWLARGTSSSLYRHLAAVTQLRRLQLDALPLFPEACLLSRLQGLTSLSFLNCCVPRSDAAAAQSEVGGGAAAAIDGPAASSMCWVAALTGLREVAMQNFDRNSPGLHLVRAVATLPFLHTLVLCEHRTDAFGAGVLEVLDRLRCVLVRLELDIKWHTLQDAAVLRAIGAVSRLRVLSLCPGRVVYAAATAASTVACLYRDLLLPASLARCYLPSNIVSTVVDHAQALHVLRARCPWVSFKPHSRPGADEW